MFEHTGEGSDVCLLRVIWFYKQNEAFLTFI